MEENQEPALFFDVQKAVASGRPFKLASFQIRPHEVSDDNWHLIHNALLLNDYLYFSIHSDQDALKVSNHLKERKTLESLIIYFEQSISDEMEVQIANVIKAFPILEICLDRSAGVNIDQFVEAISDARNIKRLIVSFLPTEHECKLLSTAIKELVLEKSSGFNNWPSLIPVLSQNASIETLELHGFDDDGAKALVEFFRTNSSIQNIAWLCSNTYARTISERSMKIFFEGYLRHQFKLKSLLSSTTIYDSSCKILSEILKTNSYLRKLDMKHTAEITDYRCKILGEGLAVNSTFQYLSLTNANSLGDDGVKILCDSLKKSSGLTVLDIYGPTMDLEQCKKIAEMLDRVPSLKSLMLACEGDGAEIICRALEHNKNLRELLLDHNQSMDLVPGTVAIKNMLAANTTLQRLEFFCDPGRDECCSLLCEGLKNNTSLRALKIHPYGDQILEQKLIEVLQANYALDTITVECIDGFWPLLRRNRELKSAARYAVAILSHNVARSHSALSTLPRELWRSILASITHPGMDNFHDLVNGIFDLYNKDVKRE